MEKIKVLIVDDNLLATAVLSDKLSTNEDLEIFTANDGVEAIEAITKEQPHVVLLDIIMPKLDGIGVLEYARTNLNVNKPIFIVYSAISQENYVSKVMNLGADYYIVKPFSEEVIAQRIRQMYYDANKGMYFKNENMKPIKANRIKRPDDEQIMILATKYMREYGLKAHMSGYGYIRDIIIASFDTYCRTGTMPKGIYRAIADKNSVSIQKVERAIRNCIENVIENENVDNRQTNSKVIGQLIEKIRLNN